MEKTADLKKALTLKGNSVKRTVKEYQYYCKDVAKEQNAFTREIKATSILCVKNFILGAFAAPIP